MYNEKKISSFKLPAKNMEEEISLANKNLNIGWHYMYVKQ